MGTGKSNGMVNFIINKTDLQITTLSKAETAQKRAKGGKRIIDINSWVLYRISEEIFIAVSPCYRYASILFISHCISVSCTISQVSLEIRIDQYHNINCDFGVLYFLLIKCF